MTLQAFLATLLAKAAARVKEALSAESLEGRADKLREAWNTIAPSYDWYVCDVFDDAIIVRNSGTEYRRVPYTIDGETITFSEPNVVEVQFQEVGEAVRILESKDKTGATWRARIVKFGRSDNGWYWTRESGEALLPHLAHAPVGCYVYANGFQAHAQAEAVLTANGAVMRNVVGDIDNPSIEADGVYADLHVHEDAGWLRQKLLGLELRGILDKVIGLSVDTLAGYVPVQLREGAAKAIKTVQRLFSVDIVTAPSADGRFIRATAGPLLTTTMERLRAPTEDVMRDQMIALVRESRPQLLEGKDIAKLTDEDVAALVKEALKTSPVKIEQPKPDPAPAPQPPAEPAWAREARAREVRAMVREAVDATQLPDLNKMRLVKRYESRVVEAEGLTAFREEIAAAVKEDVDFEAARHPSGDPKGHGIADVTAAPRDKLQVAVDRLFGVPDMAGFAKVLEAGSPFTPETLLRVTESMKPSYEAGKDPGLRFRSLKEMYIALTGDTYVTGRIPVGRAAEAALLSTTWADILGNTLYRRLLMTYAEVQYNERTISQFGTAVDFRTKDLAHMNYFVDLSTVAEDAAYVDIAVPVDDKVSYAVSKRGNLFGVTLETIANDDLRSVQEAVSRLGRSARRTLAQFIWTFWNGAGATFDVDAVAWFNAAHNNTGTLALTADTTGAAEVFAKIAQIFAFAEPGSAKVLGAFPMNSIWLDVPSALWSVARRLNIAREFGAGVTNQVFGLFGNPDDPSGGERINVNALFTDVTDWGIHLDPAASGRTSIVVDFYGQEEPTFLLANLPTQGSLFTNDRVQYKVQHIYGGDLGDIRGAAKNVVAG